MVWKKLWNDIEKASKAIDQGTNIIILSDRNVNKDKAPIPALMACSYVNNGLQVWGNVLKLVLLLNQLSLVKFIILPYCLVTVQVLSTLIWLMKLSNNCKNRTLPDYI